MSGRVSRRKPYPGPVRGTPVGDQIIGQCRGAACETQIHRGDEFIVLVGDILVCGTCRRSGVRVDTEAAR
jgi:hypothetical protein